MWRSMTEEGLQQLRVTLSSGSEVVAANLSAVDDMLACLDPAVHTYGMLFVL